MRPYESADDVKQVERMKQMQNHNRISSFIKIPSGIPQNLVALPIQTKLKIPILKKDDIEKKTISLLQKNKRPTTAIPTAVSKP